MKRLKDHLPSPYFFLGSLALIMALLSGIPGPINQNIRDRSNDLLFLSRGNRELSEKIMFIFIGQEDINALGEWPLSRDYYSYMIHHLQLAGARVIAIDILFARPDPQYPEYDRILAAMMQNSGKIILPMTFAELNENSSPDPALSGNLPTYPAEIFSHAAAGTGFSNLGNASPVRRIPVMARYKGQLYPSFGVTIARKYLEADSMAIDRNGSRLFRTGREDQFHIPVDRSGYLLLNHFGDIEDCRSISFFDFMKQADSDSLSLFVRDKIVIIGVTAPGAAVLRTTPLSDAFPGSLIHATAVENIIEQNFLRPSSRLVEVFIFFFLIIILILLWKIISPKYILTFETAVLILYGIIAIAFFNYLNISLPLIYPAILFLLSVLILHRRDIKKRSRIDIHVQELLQEQVSRKETELETARVKLAEYQSRLADTEKSSADLITRAEERERAILQLENELRDLKGYISPHDSVSSGEFAEIIHAPDSGLAESLAYVDRLRDDDIPVLLIGETGTGKEMIARAIHRTSRRKDRSFIAVNCGALSETLLESELFGHEKGSFTGAHTRRRGRFELANGGTIFLDEISETSPIFQSKLLRVLQEGIFERVGGEQSLQVDVRILAASNRDLQKEVDSGKFRSDLFYRLKGFLIVIPPLRDRIPDIPLLAHHFLEKYDYQPVEKFSDQAMDALVAYHWPGNVRELENVIRRAAIMARSEKREMIRATDLPAEMMENLTSGRKQAIYQPIEDQILETLRSYHFSHASISQTARALGNKDRGTITEYFRGICFEVLVASNFDKDQAANTLTAGLPPSSAERVRKKIQAYLDNLYPLPDLSPDTSDNLNQLPQFKKLPQKYHTVLVEVIRHLQKKQ